MNFQEKQDGDLIKTPFFNPPQSIIEFDDELGLGGIKGGESVLEIAPLDQEMPSGRRKIGTLARLSRTNRQRSVSELPRPSWDVFNQGHPGEGEKGSRNSGAIGAQGGDDPTDDLSSPFEEGMPVDISILSLAASAAATEALQDHLSSGQAGGSGHHGNDEGMATWKKLTYRTLRKKGMKAPAAGSEAEAFKLASMLHDQRIPESIISKVENGRRLVMEGSLEDLTRLLGMQTELQGDFADVFLCTYRGFTDAGSVLEALMRSHREMCIDITNEEAQLMEKATVVEWNEAVEKHLISVLTKWYLNHHQDFVEDMELDLRLRDFLRSDVFEVTTRVNIPNVLERLEKAKENYERWMQETKLMIQYRHAVEKNGAEVMRKTSTKSIFDLNVTAAVKALCQLEMDIFQKIPPWELLSMAWMSKKCEIDAPLLYEHICLFNKISNWVATEVVLTGNIDMRANLIERFITMARQAREWNNFNTTFQIVLGLHNPAVLKLKSTWRRVGKKYATALKEVSEIVNPDKNHRNYRTILAKTVPPCMPYVGMYLKDLLFANDGSKTILQNGKINFGKMNTIGMTILSIRRFQSTPYPFEDDTLIHWFRHHTFAMPEDELLAASKKLIESSEV